MIHRCHAYDCTKEVPPKLLFCARHWKMTPRSTQRLIWTTYRPGQEVDKSPSMAYLVAQSYAVADVAIAEKKWTAQQAAEHVLRELRLVGHEIDAVGWGLLEKHQGLMQLVAIWKNGGCVWCGQSHDGGPERCAR